MKNFEYFLSDLPWGRLRTGGEIITIAIETQYLFTMDDLKSFEKFISRQRQILIDYYNFIFCPNGFADKLKIKFMG